MPSLNSERCVVSSILQDYPEIQTVSDLGSGWGGLARHLASRLSLQKIIAIEKSLIPHLFSRFTSYPFHQKLISNHHEDIFNRTLKDNEAYITYLSGPAMKKLRKNFERDQPTGGLLISIAFAMPGWTPSKTEYAAGALRSAVYVYEY